MASTLKHLRSSTSDKRPTASGLADGQLAINTASGTPALFFKDNHGTVVKVGPAHVGAAAPNAVPAGSAGNSLGELWVNNSLTTAGLNYYTGSGFVNLTPSGTETTIGLVELATAAETQTGTDAVRVVTPSGLQSKVSDSISTTSSTTIASSTAVKTAYDLAHGALPKTGGIITGALEIGTTGSLVFEGSSNDSFDTTIAVVNPTASRVFTLPNISGTAITNADTGTVTSTMIANDTIVNADINSAAAIAYSKLALSSGIVNTDINASAAIAYSKLALSSGIINTDISASAAIVYSKLALSSGIIDTDISASAEIAVSKLADGTARQLLQTDAAGTGVEWASNIDVPGTLDVTSAATFDSTVSIPLGAAATPSLYFGADSNTGIYSPAADTIAFSEGGVEAMRITSAGLVGIGTSAPDRLLHLSGADTAYLRLENQDATGSVDQYVGLIEFEGQDSGGSGVRAQIGAIYEGVSGATAVTIGTSADAGSVTERVRINRNGNVGIGATTPRDLLHLYGAGQTTANIADSGTRGCFLRVSQSGSAAGTGGGILFASEQGDATNSVGFAAIKGLLTDGSNNTTGALAFSVRNTSSATSLQEAFRIDSSGRLLVGTSTSIAGTGGTAGQIQLHGASGGGATQSVNNWSSSGSDPARILLGKSLGGSVGTRGVVTSGSHLGIIRFAGDDGTNFIDAATISAFVDGTPGTDDMPGRLVFSTTADGASSPTERMRITNAGLVGIGTASPSVALDVVGTSNVTVSSLAQYFGINATGTAGSVSTGLFAPAGNTLGFVTGTTERMRIDSGGNILIGQSTTTTPGLGNNTVGSCIDNAGTGFFSRAAVGLRVNRTADGAVVAFASAGIEEGNISISGTTTSYNGAHLSRWSQLPNNAERTEILRGSVLSNIDEMCEWGEEDNEQLNRMKVSDVEGDKNVSGVFQAWDDDDETYTDDFYCAMTGDFIIRIAEGVTVERGDLLMSAGDGTAKPQDDDIIRSKTIAKVTSTNVSCTYDDGSYCVPCVLMAC